MTGLAEKEDQTGEMSVLTGETTEEAAGVETEGRPVVAEEAQVDPVVVVAEEINYSDAGVLEIRKAIKKFRQEL